MLRVMTIKNTFFKFQSQSCRRPTSQVTSSGMQRLPGSRDLQELHDHLWRRANQHLRHVLQVRHDLYKKTRASFEILVRNHGMNMRPTRCCQKYSNPKVRISQICSYFSRQTWRFPLFSPLTILLRQSRSVSMWTLLIPFRMEMQRHVGTEGQHYSQLRNWLRGQPKSERDLLPAVTLRYFLFKIHPRLYFSRSVGQAAWVFKKRSGELPQRKTDERRKMN